MERTVRVGVMPGRISEFAVEEGQTIAELLELAELNASGYDVKVDGVKVTNLDTPITSTTNLVLLAKQVKGNADGYVRIGVMPGRINEYAVELGNTVGQALELAELNASGYDVKVDGTKVNLDHKITANTNLILLAKQVKGN